MKKILIVEDEQKLSRFIELELNYEGFDVVKAFDGRKGLELALSEEFSLILLDIMLPKMNGIEILRRVRKEKNTPIIMLTAKDEISDKVIGLDLGADDYITKPFAIEELLARIRVALRHEIINDESDSKIISCGNLSINEEQYKVTYSDDLIELTKKEYDLLKYLLVNKGIVLTRDSILKEVWGYDYYGDTNIVDVYIRYLRGKIDDVYDKKLIFTVRGVGYVMKEE